MTMQKGRELSLAIGSDGGFVPVAGMRARRIAFDAQQVETTDAGSSGRWRELLGRSGVRRAAVSGSGIFRNANSDALVRSAFFAGTIPDWRISIPGLGVLSGPFQIVSLEYRGDIQGEMAFAIALESAGEIAFEAA